MTFSIDSNGNPVAISGPAYNERLEGMGVCLNATNFWRSRAVFCSESNNVTSLEQISEAFNKMILSWKLDAVISSMHFPQSHLCVQMSLHLCYVFSWKILKNQLSWTHTYTFTTCFHCWSDVFARNTFPGNKQNGITLHTITPSLPCFLKIAINITWSAKMDDLALAFAVNAHTKRNSCYQYNNLSRRVY